MRYGLVLISFFLYLACQTDSAKPWHELDLGSFKVNAPGNWSTFKEEGVDASVGGITNGTDTLYYYYGWYISGPKDETTRRHLYAQDTINGHMAVLVMPKQDSVGGIEVFIPNVTDKDQFALGGYGIKDNETVLKIFKSVKFENSDTSRNSTLDLAKFREYPFGSGRTLYYGYCSPCHYTVDREDGAPPLEKVMRNRNVDWIYKFLTDRKSIAGDSLKFPGFNQSITACFEFEEFSKRDVEQLVEYIKTFKPAQ
jgi:hypothetical protein